MSTLSARHGWTLRKGDDLACTCTPANPKHVSGWQCVTHEQLQAWYTREYMQASLPKMARQLAFMWLHFSRDPVAKKMSGRR
jgi:hypothetical protein